MSQNIAYQPSKRSLGEIEDEKSLKEAAIHSKKRQLKPKRSFNAEFWLGMVEMAQLELRQAQLHFEKLEVEFMSSGNGGITDFLRTDEALKVTQEMKGFEIHLRMCKRQAKRVETEGKPEKSGRRAFMELFTSSRLGMDIVESAARRRDTSDQSNFRKNIEKAYGLMNAKKDGLVWDVISGQSIPEDMTTAAHLFAYKHGQDVMTALMGEDVQNELFAPTNGLILPNSIEKHFDSGLFAIVPNMNENSVAEVSLWLNSTPKEYKIKILNFESKHLDQVVVQNKNLPNGQLTWRELHNRKLMFPNNFRPRSRFLYFHYMVQILRKAWSNQSKAPEVLKKEFGAAVWGTKGKYLAKAQLRAFVDELGHEVDFLLDGEDDTRKVQKGSEELLTVAVTGQIKRTGCEDDEESSDEEEDDS
jgi:hypothetical protein